MYLVRKSKRLRGKPPSDFTLPKQTRKKHKKRESDSDSDNSPVASSTPATRKKPNRLLTIGPSPLASVISPRIPTPEERRLQHLHFDNTKEDHQPGPVTGEAETYSPSRGTLTSKPEAQDEAPFEADPQYNPIPEHPKEPTTGAIRDSPALITLSSSGQNNTPSNTSYKPKKLTPSLINEEGNKTISSFQKTHDWHTRNWLTELKSKGLSSIIPSTNISLRDLHETSKNADKETITSRQALDQIDSEKPTCSKYLESHYQKKNSEEKDLNSISTAIPVINKSPVEIINQILDESRRAYDEYAKIGTEPKENSDFIKKTIPRPSDPSKIPTDSESEKAVTNPPSPKNSKTNPSKIFENLSRFVCTNFEHYKKRFSSTSKTPYNSIKLPHSGQRTGTISHK